MSAETAKKYDAEKYWAERYQEIDLTKSGHIDLPVVYNQWLYRRKKERLLQGLYKAGFDPKGASILEIAAGTGVYVEMWKSLGVGSLSGIDISQNATDALAKRFPEYSFHKRDLTEPGLAALTGKGHDLVTAVDMLYHVVDDKDFPTALSNLADSCRPGGFLAIHDFFMHHRELDFGYIKLRTLKDYQVALDKAGFEIISRTPTFFLTVQTYDYKSLDTKKSMDRIWSRFIDPFITRSPGLAGRLGYYSDRILGAFIKEGPSFEMMICRRKA
ncbi:MAG: class SAM-dependent methyltransferase [Fibrobacteres bacterium]|nr:class SAM-dependent methyltransferase [Fibrobacterota bacterium]